ncbi:MAG: TetR/AcrR family transcriptional regulator [Arthrobacter sp.]|uniref:TetR/AcrR family transcriptional regulator n=1 Tax=Arthrobacter sp. TaxID=1667 RepID=UPI00347E5305
MSRPPAAREKILDAYCDLLRRDGERAATMDSTAALAGVSKGGLLYHFKSKDALAEAVVERLLAAAERDQAVMATAGEGASRYFVRTSLQSGSDLDTTYSAVVRLAAGAYEPAVRALDTVHRGWLELIQREVGDPHAAGAIMLMGEGLYYHSTLPGTWSRGTFVESLDELLRQVDRLKSGS